MTNGCRLIFAGLLLALAACQTPGPVGGDSAPTSAPPTFTTGTTNPTPPTTGDTLGTGPVATSIDPAAPCDPPDRIGRNPAGDTYVCGRDGRWNPL